MDVIIGAGLSGLICGALNAKAQIFESNPPSAISHRAVLRFRDNKIARALGIDFRKVTVHKSIWDGKNHITASPRSANQYSRKVRGIISSNSIWNLSTAERYIAPEDFHAQLIDICGERITWGTNVTRGRILAWKAAGKRIVSTIPLPSMIDLIEESYVVPEFKFAKISVQQYRIENCDVFQTIYFPSNHTSIYRASITGNLLITESIDQTYEAEAEMVFNAFGIDPDSATLILANHSQKFGKIIPIPDEERKALLHSITMEYGVYSLGRFATWRNILLDDVFEDIAAIRKMMNQSQYDAALGRLS